MQKKVILILEYEFADYDDSSIKDRGGKVSENPNDYVEAFLQSDIYPNELSIVGVKIIDIEEENY